MGELEGDLETHDATFFAVYTQEGLTAPMDFVMERVGPYLDGRYFTGTMPPITIEYYPATAVIDMQTGELLAKDVNLATQLMPDQVLEAVDQAAAE